MKELQDELDRLLEIREEYLKAARNDEELNDKIRELQSQLRQFKST